VKYFLLFSGQTDYLKPFPELGEYRFKATDGHFVQHAFNTEKIVWEESSQSQFIKQVTVRYKFI
jgi:hypothetical protein